MIQDYAHPSDGTFKIFPIHEVTSTIEKSGIMYNGKLGYNKILSMKLFIMIFILVIYNMR